MSSSLPLHLLLVIPQSAEKHMYFNTSKFRSFIIHHSQYSVLEIVNLMKMPFVCHIDGHLFARCSNLLYLLNLHDAKK